MAGVDEPLVCQRFFITEVQIASESFWFVFLGLDQLQKSNIVLLYLLSSITLCLLANIVGGPRFFASF